VDKRRAQRVVSELKVSYTIIAKVDSTPFEFGNSMMCDISRAGLAMLVDMPVPVPMLLQMQLSIPTRPSGLFVLGKSVYCVPVEELGMYRVGVKFVGILPSDLEEIIREFQGSRRLPASA